MSTKTSIKRIAAVAALALTLGGFSAVSANAYTLEGGFRTLSWGATPAATGTTLVKWSAVVKVNASCSELGTNNGLVDAVVATTTAQLDQAPIGSNLLSNSVTWATGTPTGYTNSNATAAVAAYSDESTGYRKATSVGCIASSSAMVGYKTVEFTPDKAGTYVVVLLPKGATTGALTTTITVTDPTQKFATAFINTNLGADSTADAESLVFAAPANVTAKARVTVKQYSTADATTLTTDTISKDVVVAISKGLVSKTNDYFAAAKSVTTATATGSTSQYYVFANGEVGSADLTVTVGGTLVSTKKITFNGLAASMTAALTTGQNSWIAPNGTATLTVGSKDSAGNASSNTPAITATSATTSVATVVATSSTLVTITGVAAGTSVITIADAAGTATSATYTVTVAPAASATLPTITFDKAEYNAGELMTITIGAAAADNATFAAFTAAPTTSVNVVTVKNPFTGGAVALVSGKATWTAYAPISAGPITVTATSGAGSSATAAAVTATATVLTDGVAQAAADAAAEAIDAANAATDAANAAAEAADAATAAAQDAADAVAALSVQVSEQIAELKAQNDALRKQLIALTNLIIKIQKKVKA
jgi:hypothetical protein